LFAAAWFITADHNFINKEIIFSCCLQVLLYLTGFPGFPVHQNRVSNIEAGLTPFLSISQRAGEAAWGVVCPDSHGRMTCGHGCQRLLEASFGWSLGVLY